VKRYVIERSIPGVGRLNGEQLRAVADSSNRAIAALGCDLQWVHSYIAADNTFCVYLATGEDVLREHSRIAGFPITRINEVATVIDPLTAFQPSDAKTA
jgi:hypothetical protein